MTTQTAGHRSTTAKGTGMRGGLGTGTKGGLTVTAGETGLRSRTGAATGAVMRTGGTDMRIAAGTDMAAAALPGATSARIMGETSCLWHRTLAASSGERLGRACLWQAGGLQYVREQVRLMQEIAPFGERFYLCVPLTCQGPGAAAPGTSGWRQESCVCLPLAAPASGSTCLWQHRACSEGRSRSAWRRSW